jgi:hypothetical protein
MTDADPLCLWLTRSNEAMPDRQTIRFRPRALAARLRPYFDGWGN